MANIKVNSIESLVQEWLKAEENGELFPVPFEDAWIIAGYSKKANAKRKLTSKSSYLVEGEDFSIEKGEVLRSEQSALYGRSSDSIKMSCDAFKHFCMMAETDQGRQVRRYFIEAEKKWRLVEKHHPEVAESVEERLMDKAIALEKLRLESRQLDHTMLIMHGKETVLTLRGMGDQIVETEKPTIEVIDARHNVTFKGQTLAQVKDYVLKKYGVKFKSGVDIKRFLEKKGEGHLIAQTLRSVSSEYIPEENLEAVYKVLQSDSRQMLLGE